MALPWPHAHQCQSDVLVRRLQRCRFPVNLQRFFVSPRVVIQSPQRGQDLSLPGYLQCPGVWEKGMLQGGVRSKVEERGWTCAGMENHSSAPSQPGKNKFQVLGRHECAHSSNRSGHLTWEGERDTSRKETPPKCPQTCSRRGDG